MAEGSGAITSFKNFYSNLLTHDDHSNVSSCKKIALSVAEGVWEQVLASALIVSGLWCIQYTPEITS